MMDQNGMWNPRSPSPVTQPPVKQSLIDGASVYKKSKLKMNEMFPRIHPTSIFLISASN